MNLRNAVRSEDTEQITVINWAEWNRQRYPELKWLHHCPNGGSRNRISRQGSGNRGPDVFAGVFEKTGKTA